MHILQHFYFNVRVILKNKQKQDKKATLLGYGTLNIILICRRNQHGLHSKGKMYEQNKP